MQLQIHKMHDNRNREMRNSSVNCGGIREIYSQFTIRNGEFLEKITPYISPNRTPFLLWRPITIKIRSAETSKYKVCINH